VVEAAPKANRMPAVKIFLLDWLTSKTPYEIEDHQIGSDVFGSARKTGIILVIFLAQPGQ
jgi:hypothetical protein